MKSGAKILIVSPVSSDESASMELYRKGLVRTLKGGGVMVEELHTINHTPFLIFSKINEIFCRYIYYSLKIATHSAGTIHITDHTYAFLCPIVKLTKKQCIVTVHNDLNDVLSSETWEKHKEQSLVPKLSQFLFRFSLSQLRFADKIICVTNSIRLSLLTGGYPNHKLTVIPAPISDTFLHPLTKQEQKELRHRIRDKQNTFYILHVGNNDTAHKNIEHVLRCLETLRYNARPVTLLKVGDAFTSSQQTYIREHDLQKHIIHFGGLPQQKIKLIYYLSDVLLFPSLYEGIPAVPVEALACGLPVILSRIPSHKKIFSACAYFCDPHDHSSSVRILHRFIQKDRRENTFTSEGKRVARSLRWQNFSSQFLALYQEPHA